MRKGGEHAAVKLMFEISSGWAGSSMIEKSSPITIVHETVLYGSLVTYNTSQLAF